MMLTSPSICDEIPTCFDETMASDLSKSALRVQSRLHGLGRCAHRHGRSTSYRASARCARGHLTWKEAFGSRGGGQLAERDVPEI